MREHRNVLVTGAAGFVGRALVKALQANELFRVTALARDSRDDLGFAVCPVGEMDGATSYTQVLAGIEVVIHTAARAHVMSDSAADPLAEYRRANVEATVNLARQAAAAGVKRFIFLSSIKVNGESTPPGQPFTARDVPRPEDFYAVSKLEAEQALLELSANSGMQVVIIRPPLVYGPGVKGNFASMARIVAKGLPLPLGAVDNRRSLVSLGNLLSLVIRCIDHPAAAGRVFLVSDGEDLSTAALLKRLANSGGFKSRLIPLPVGLLQAAARLLGKGEVAQRLLSSLQVDISETCRLLDWQPVCSVDEGLAKVYE